MAEWISGVESVSEWRLNFEYGSSYFWNAFLLPYEGSQNCVGKFLTVKCACCGAMIKLNKDLSTSNMKAHWESIHPKVKIPGQSGTSYEALIRTSFSYSDCRCTCVCASFIIPSNSMPTTIHNKSLHLARVTQDLQQGGLSGRIFF